MCTITSPATRSQDHHPITSACSKSPPSPTHKAVRLWRATSSEGSVPISWFAPMSLRVTGGGRTPSESAWGVFSQVNNYTASYCASFNKKFTYPDQRNYNVRQMQHLNQCLSNKTIVSVRVLAATNYRLLQKNPVDIKTVNMSLPAWFRPTINKPPCRSLWVRSLHHTIHPEAARVATIHDSY